MRRSATFLVLLCFSLFAISTHAGSLLSVYAQDVIILSDPSYDSDNNSFATGDSSKQDQTVTLSDAYSSSLYETEGVFDNWPENDDDMAPESEYSLLYEAESEAESKSDPDPYLQSGTARTDAVLVIDVSGSMIQNDPDYLCKNAALEFIKSLSGNPSSRVALVTFSDTIISHLPLTSLEHDNLKGSITEELDHLTYTKGDTDIGCAMQEATAILMEESMENRAKSIFLLTDGEIDLPQAEDEEAAEKESLTRALVAVEDAKEQGIVIHTITLDLSGSIDTNLMNYMADSTGGSSSHVDTPDRLEDVFLKLAEYARKQALELSMTEEMTESETELQTEAVPETETETEVIPFVRSSGSIQSPVHLKGLLPGMCKAELNLNHLFYIDNSPYDNSLSSGVDSFSSSDLTDFNTSSADNIIYTAYADDKSLLDCQMKDGILNITGIKNGTSQVHVLAEPYDPVKTDSQQASQTFIVTVEAILPSPIYLFAIPCVGILIGMIIVIVHHRSRKAYPLSGTLRWYVRGENEKIFGMPGQLYANLNEFGSRVLLSELIQDELLMDADLHKVMIRGMITGICITSKSSDCMIQVSGYEPERSIDLTSPGQFKVICETSRGRAAVIASYSPGRKMQKEPSYEDDSDEKTRRLI